MFNFKLWDISKLNCKLHVTICVVLDSISILCNASCYGYGEPTTYYL